MSESAFSTRQCALMHPIEFANRYFNTHANIYIIVTVAIEQTIEFARKYHLNSHTL